MELEAAGDQDMSCQCWKECSKKLTELCIDIKGIAHQFDKATTSSQCGGGQSHDLDYNNIKSIMDDLSNSIHNLQKEVYRHFMELRSVPLRDKRGRTDNERDSAYDSVNFGTPVPETGDDGDKSQDLQASEHDEDRDG